MQRHRSVMNAHAESYQMTNRIMCHEGATLLKLNLFQLMEQHRSLDSILILIYQIDAHTTGNKNAHARAMKKRFAFDYESSLTKVIQQIYLLLLDVFGGWSWHKITKKPGMKVLILHFPWTFFIVLKILDEVIISLWPHFFTDYCEALSLSQIFILIDYYTC